MLTLSIRHQNGRAIAEQNNINCIFGAIDATNEKKARKEKIIIATEKMEKKCCASHIVYLIVCLF